MDPVVLSPVTDFAAAHIRHNSVVVSRSSFPGIGEDISKQEEIGIAETKTQVNDAARHKQGLQRLQGMPPFPTFKKLSVLLARQHNALNIAYVTMRFKDEVELSGLDDVSLLKRLFIGYCAEWASRLPRSKALLEKLVVVCCDETARTERHNPAVDFMWCSGSELARFPHELSNFSSRKLVKAVTGSL
jgi:hypothetical protein